MAQKSAPVYLVGTVVKSERRNGTFAGSNGETIAFDFITAKVITPEFDSLEVRFPSDGTVALPQRDELVNLDVEARVAGGDLQLRVKAVEVVGKSALSA